MTNVAHLSDRKRHRAMYPPPSSASPAGMTTATVWPGDELNKTGAWQERALCAQTDPDAFFPDMGESSRQAKSVCAACEVRSECLEWALTNDERFGVWGGLSERERRRFKKEEVTA